MSPRVDGKPRQANFFNICRECPNGCCTRARPPLTSRRRHIIQEFIGRKHIDIDNPFQNGKYVFPRATKDGRCIFLDRVTRRCKIHPVKPETCVAGPVTSDINPKTGKIEWFLKTDRTCRLAAPLYKDSTAYARHLRCAKHEIRHLIFGLDAEALHAILTIEERDTIKVDEDRVPPRLLSRLKL